MKKFKIFLYTSLLLIGYSCSDEYSKIKTGDQYTTIYMAQAKEAVQATLFMKEGAQTLHVGASYGGLDLPKGDIDVVLNVAPELVEIYNEAHKTSYEILPADSYLFENRTAHINAGNTTSDPLTIAVYTHGKLEAKKQYLLPVTIVSNTGNLHVKEELKTTYFIINSEYARYDRSEWKIIDFSSEEVIGEGVNKGYAKNTIDNNVDTYWHTQYNPIKLSFPHWITIDMGKDIDILGFNITGRIGRTVANPKDIIIEVSTDNQVWNAVGNYELKNINVNEIILQNAFKARYLKLTINTSWGYPANLTYIHTHISEIEVF